MHFYPTDMKRYTMCPQALLHAGFPTCPLPLDSASAEVLEGGGGLQAAGAVVLVRNVHELHAHSSQRGACTNSISATLCPAFKSKDFRVTQRNAKAPWQSHCLLALRIFGINRASCILRCRTLPYPKLRRSWWTHLPECCDIYILQIFPSSWRQPAKP